MKKIVLSTITSLVIANSIANADVTIKSGAATLKFNGEHYIGFTKFSDDINSSNDYTRFEGRRNYLQVKAYFDENPKDYMRVTIDTTKTDGDMTTRVKYAYLYLDNILPYTGVEIGQAHRPWIDYEEHNGWLYRSISKVLVEAKMGAHLTNSADRGINFKTKTNYFSSELGVFNGEGYHESQKGTGLSKEWRLTWHILGTGKVHHPKQYANLSFFGQVNSKYEDRKDAQGNSVDLKWAGIHGVYKNDDFLLAAQYVKVSDGNYYDGGKKYVEGKGYSVNGSYKFIPKWELLAKYDFFKFDADGRDSTSSDAEKNTRVLAGISYKYNKNVKFILNGINEKQKAFNGNDRKKQKFAMLTAEVKW